MAKPLSELKTYLKKKFLERKIGSLVDDSFLEELAIVARDIIYKRTKTGRGLNSNKLIGAEEEPLPKLDKEYKKYRARRDLGPLTEANRRNSNLTLSGELLESILYRVVNNQAILYIDNKQHEEANMPTVELALILRDKGYRFFGISSKEEKILNVFLQRLIRKRVRELNGRE